MAVESAELRGGVTLRPWRIGLLVDTSSAAEVRRAIATLSSVWGGTYMPILDIRSPIRDLEHLGDLFDVDSLYAEEVEGELGDFLRQPGWRWEGRGHSGAFAEFRRIRNGLLPARAFLDESTDFVQPTWEPDDPHDLTYAVAFGLSEDLGVTMGQGLGGWPLAGLTALAGRVDQHALVGALELGRQHTRPAGHAYLDGAVGIQVVRPGDLVDVLSVWNWRAMGASRTPIPSTGATEVVDYLIRRTALKTPPTDGDDLELQVWGLEHADNVVSSSIAEAAAMLGRSVRPQPTDHPFPSQFSGIETSFRSSIRASLHPSAIWVDCPLPRLPLADETTAISRGIVAARVQWQEAQGLDPRVTANPPPYRRLSKLLRHVWSSDGAQQMRVSTAGVVLGLDASLDRVQAPLVNNLAIYSSLFDDESVSVTQSDVGRFQTRAAERFGGPLSGYFNQPSAREALLLCASKTGGVPLQHLVQTARDHRAGWPHPVMDHQDSPEAYAARISTGILQSGLVEPISVVHCSHCRVETRVPAELLAASMTCQFCRAEYPLALSHALKRPEWRYRIAQPIRHDQIQALLPALAAASTLAKFRHVQETDSPLVLGLQIKGSRRSVEVDLAMYFGDPEWIAILGEVKYHNRVDAHDVANLEYLRDQLTVAGVRTVLMFATLKESFGDDEVRVLRRLSERAPVVRNSRGNALPNLPLVLTNSDLSRHPWDEEQPWRWDDPTHSGVLGTAIASCRRNLGLEGYDMPSLPDGRATLSWS